MARTKTNRTTTSDATQSMWLDLTAGAPPQGQCIALPGGGFAITTVYRGRMVLSHLPSPDTRNSLGPI